MATEDATPEDWEAFWYGVDKPKKPVYSNSKSKVIHMSLSKRLNEELKEVESHLRTALTFAARNERPEVCTQISKMLKELSDIRTIDNVLEMIDRREQGSSGLYGPDDC